MDRVRSVDGSAATPTRRNVGTLEPNLTGSTSTDVFRLIQPNTATATVDKPKYSRKRDKMNSQIEANVRHSGTVYVIHFEPSFKHARHYVGFTKRTDYMERINEHKEGKGSKLTQAAVKAGCKVQLVVVIEDATRHDERAIKNRKNTPKMCPTCKGK